MTDINDFLNEATIRVEGSSIQNEQQALTELTESEEEELRQFALQRMENMAAAQQEQEESVEEEPEEDEEEEPENEEETPAEEYDSAAEDVVEVPDYTDVRDETTRFSSAEWFEKVKQQVVILAGVGGIGSNAALYLAKLNPKAIYIFDYDTVETVNLAGQFYDFGSVGQYKVDALAESIVRYTNYSSVFACRRAYDMSEEIVGDIMICGFDNMSARRKFFAKWLSNALNKPEEERKNCLFIDGRLTADELQIFCMTGVDDYYIDKYKSEYLFSDLEAENTMCSFKQTGYLAGFIGSLITNLFVNHCANLSNPLRNMPLPFKTSYKADIMYLDTEK